MNQEKIGKFIKKIRTDNHLSQEKFGEKYGVTYQAVSKWENGKNLPDIAIIKEICNEYNIDINELIDGNNLKKKNKLIIFILIMVFIVFLGLGILFMVKNNNNDFHFKTIKTNCNDFELYGSMAYSSNKTSIYISNITYCGVPNNTKYKEIKCTMYEIDGNTKTKIESYNEQDVTLENFLEQVKFNVDHYSDTCKMYKENGLILEIEATNDKNQTVLYEIPLELEDNCK